jgi:muconolactone delta-isomerase
VSIFWRETSRHSRRAISAVPPFAEQLPSDEITMADAAQMLSPSEKSGAEREEPLLSPVDVDVDVDASKSMSTDEESDGRADDDPNSIADSDSHSDSNSDSHSHSGSDSDSDSDADADADADEESSVDVVSSAPASTDGAAADTVAVSPTLVETQRPRRGRPRRATTNDDAGSATPPRARKRPAGDAQSINESAAGSAQASPPKRAHRPAEVIAAEKAEKEARRAAKAAQRAAKAEDARKRDEDKAAKKEERQRALDESRARKEAEKKAKEEDREATRRAREDKRLREEAEKKAREEEREAARQKVEIEKKAKEEKRAREEADKRAKEELRAREEAEKKAKEEKQKRHLSAFWKSVCKNAEPSSAKPAESNNELFSSVLFLPFERQENMTLAPLCRAPCVVDSPLEAQPASRSWLAEIHHRKHVAPPRAVAVVSTIAGEEQVPLPRLKLLQFWENVRPAYYGTRRPSTVVTGRRILSRDEDVDYDYDSEAEWEEEVCRCGRGKRSHCVYRHTLTHTHTHSHTHTHTHIATPCSLVCSQDEKGEDIDTASESSETGEAGPLPEEDEEEDDGFVVPHGYLSDDEGAASGAEDDGHDAVARITAATADRDLPETLADRKQRGKQASWEVEAAKKWISQRVIVVGPLWTAAEAPSDDATVAVLSMLHNLRARFFTLDPEPASAGGDESSAADGAPTSSSRMNGHAPSPGRKGSAKHEAQAAARRADAVPLSAGEGGDAPKAGEGVEGASGECTAPAVVRRVPQVRLSGEELRRFLRHVHNSCESRTILVDSFVAVAQNPRLRKTALYETLAAVAQWRKRRWTVLPTLLAEHQLDPRSVFSLSLSLSRSLFLSISLDLPLSLYFSLLPLFLLTHRNCSTVVHLATAVSTAALAHCSQRRPKRPITRLRA